MPNKELWTTTDIYDDLWRGGRSKAGRLVGWPAANGRQPLLCRACAGPMHRAA